MDLISDSASSFVAHFAAEETKTRNEQPGNKRTTPSKSLLENRNRPCNDDVHGYNIHLSLLPRVRVLFIDVMQCNGRKLITIAIRCQMTLI